MSWKKIDKIKFYCFYYNGVPVPVVIEARNKNEARSKLRAIRNTLPEYYVKSHVVGETVKSPVFGVSNKTIDGIKYIWVGEEHTKDGWIDEKKYNE
jgi:hypothetical protein